METLQSFFTQLFTELNNEDSVAILFFLFISFLIGLIFGRFSMRGKYRRAAKALKQKESELISLQAEHNVLQTQFGENELQIKRVQVENQDLKARIAQVEEAKIEMQGNIYASAEQMDKLKRDNLSYLSQIEELNNKIAVLQASNTNLGYEAVSGNDLSQIQNSYKETINRIDALENKLKKIEKENSGLRTEITTLKENTSVAFVDVNLDENGEPEMEETREEIALKAKKAIKSALGKKIPSAKAKDKNDLAAINGVGPFIEGKLNEIGIYTYEQISKFDDEFIALVTDAIQYFPGRIKRDNWVGQAKKLAKKQ